MARIKLDIPESFIANFTIPIRIADINYGNHVGNDAFVSIIHEARMQWLQLHGYTELKIETIGLIMSDLAFEFKAESFYGDMIEVKMAIKDITRVSFDLYYQLSTKRNDTLVLLAIAKTGMVCYDYSAKKVASIPEKLLNLMQA